METSPTRARNEGGLGQDITEGKRRLVVIHTLEKAEPEDRRRLIGILDIHTTDQEIRDEAISIIREHGPIEYAESFAQNMVRESWREVDAILPSSEAKEKLKAFADYLIKRKI